MFSDSHRSPATRFRLFVWTLGGFLLLLAWDYSGFDLAMAAWFGSGNGFALDKHWLLRGMLHDDIKLLPWLVELALLVACVRPFGALKQLNFARRLQLALTTLATLLVVSAIKIHSYTSCPWDLRQFGGVASHVSHWAWGVADGGTGGCFPAGHALSGFAFVGGFFAFRPVRPKIAWRWFAASMLAGFILGMAQQMRGAHYMSHTLWTAWICWTVSALIDLAVSRMIARNSSRVRAPARVRSAPTPSMPAVSHGRRRRTAPTRPARRCP